MSDFHRSTSRAANRRPQDSSAAHVIRLDGWSRGRHLLAGKSARGTSTASGCAVSTCVDFTAGVSDSVRTGGGPSSAIQPRLPKWLAAVLLVAYCSVFWIGLGTLIHWLF
ncbi:MAG: hypothetical protein ACOC0P_06140 [Planctomycetota bacterium]